jgi:ABC-type phosphate transport system permease subunit
MNNEIKDAKWKKEDSNVVKFVVFGFSFILFLVVLITAFFLLSACTLSFQNISTHGTATDLVDEDQTTSPSTNATIPVNVSAVPKA